MKEIVLFQVIERLYELGRLYSLYLEDVKKKGLCTPISPEYLQFKKETAELLNTISLRDIDNNIWAFLRENHLPALATMSAIVNNDSRHILFFIGYEFDAIALNLPLEEVLSDDNSERYDAFKAMALAK